VSCGLFVQVLALRTVSVDCSARLEFGMSFRWMVDGISDEGRMVKGAARSMFFRGRSLSDVLDAFPDAGC